MTKYMYVIFDSKARLFSNPFYTVSDIVALRDFKRAANDKNSDIYHSPDDYELHLLGQFNDETGEITLVPRQYIQTASFLRNFDGE